MIPLLTFPIVAAGLVFLAGRKDSARDPRLTITLLAMLALFPLLTIFLPKLPILPEITTTHAEDGSPWGKVLLGIWISGIGLSALRLLSALVILRNWKRRSTLAEVIDGVEIRESRNFQGPAAAGIWQPVVFMPVSWREWPAETRAAVLTHELSHHTRRDPLWRLLAEIACAIHWYHPLARWIKHRMIIQCELACDRQVIAQGIRPQAYASLLCGFSDITKPPSFAIPMAEKSSLETRIEGLLNPRKSLDHRLLWALVGFGTIAAVSLAMLERQPANKPNPSPAEIQLRLTADPFPGNR
jgi:beta-lactamase regulating signal transducer with metallopeptidase domain